MDTSINPEEMKNLAITLGAPYAQQNELGDTLGRSNELGASLPAPSGPDLSIAPKPARGTLDGDKAERSRMLQTGAGEDQIYGKVTNSSFGQNHPLLGKILGGLGQGAAKLGDIGLSAVAPALAINLPGTEYHHNAQLRQINNQIGSEDKEGQEEAQTQNLQSEIPMHQAMTQHENAQTTALQNPQPKPKEEHWSVAPEVTGPNGEPIEVEQNSGQVRIAGQDVGATRVEKQAKESTPQSQTYDSLVKGGLTPVEAYERIREKPAGSAGEGTWAIAEDAQGKPALFNSKTGQMKDAPAGLQKSGTFAKTTKPTADEQRRSDLAENLNENLSTLKDIVQRRPELFGPLAGRWAELKQKFGSDDADLGTLQTIEHQIGMAQISAHGMRSAQGIEGAGHSILNGLHSGPKALLASIEAAENSVKTFTGDVENKGKTAPPEGASDEVFAKDGKTLIGHVVNGKYIALGGK